MLYYISNKNGIYYSNEYVLQTYLSIFMSIEEVGAMGYIRYAN